VVQATGWKKIMKRLDLTSHFTDTSDNDRYVNSKSKYRKVGQPQWNKGRPLSCWNWDWGFQSSQRNILYFIDYNAHTSIVCTWISQWFLAKKILLFFKNNFTRINHCKFILHRSHLKPFLSYLPCIVRREYFSIIFSAKSVHYAR